MKKYIIPTAKAANIYTPTILAGSPGAPSLDLNSENEEGESRSKGIWGSLDD